MEENIGSINDTELNGHYICVTHMVDWLMAMY